MDSFRTLVLAQLQGSVFQRLRDLLDKRIDELTKPMTSYEDGWQFKQAHYNGQLEELMTIRKYITEIK